jgi:DNA-binding CsgD family transcriptional regulator
MAEGTVTARVRLDSERPDSSAGPAADSAQGRLASVSAARALVGDAFAGIILFDPGTEALPGLPGDDLFDGDSALLQTVRARSIDGEVHMAFLWPNGDDPGVRSHVRVTYLAPTEEPVPGLLGIVMLSPAGAGRGLTPRELEVLGMMVEGQSNQQIAGALVVTLRTVATHVEHILAKLSSPTRTHAAVHAQREGLYVPAISRASSG